VTAPAISGTASDGAALTLDRGTWSGTPTITYTYRWQRCDPTGGGCADIAGATSTAYTLTSADVDHTITAVVTASNAGGTQSRAAAPTALVVAAVPAVTSAPTINGQPRDGQMLSADRGSWSGTTPITYAYQWQRCDADGSNCSDITSATASIYQLTSADAGRTVRVAVTARNVAGSASQTSAPTATVAANAPANVTVPTVTGTARDNQTLTAAPGAWSGTTPIGYGYRWRRCDADGSNCSDIAGATGSTYDLTTSDVGHAIRVVVTATNGAGSDTAVSAATAAVAAQAPISSVPPTISGTASDGATLTADRGTWSGTPTISYAYQWRRCGATGAGCADIPGATSSSYELTGADVGATIRVAVTASNAGGATTRSSDPTAAIVAAAPANDTLPAISGIERDGSTLTATGGTWSGTGPISYAYQWRRCDADGSNCSDVAGAGSATYPLTAADVGARLRVTVTATNAAGSSAATSAPTDAIAALAPAVTTAPAISGPARDGATLTADHGTWTGTAPIAYGYRWRRCDAAGAGCSDIAGADDAGYVQSSADVDHTLRVQVTATNAGGSTAATSAATAAVAAVAPTSTVAPEVTGVPRVGQTLHAGHGDWNGTTPLTYVYQWQRCAADGTACADVAGQTTSAYPLTSDDLDHAVRVVVSATNAAGTAARASSATAAVTGAPAILTPPRLSGTAQDGSTLTADHGTWSGNPTSYSYQWQRCAADGSGCVDIPGATAGSYPLTPDDVGHVVRVVVTAGNAEGSDSATATSGPVAAAPPTPTTPNPTAPGPAPATGQGSPPTPSPTTDLSTLPGSLVGDRACQTVTTGRATRRATLSGVGAVLLRVRADAVVAPDAPMRVSVTTPRGRTVAASVTLDGRALRLGSGNPRAASIAPARLGRPGTHMLVARAASSRRAATLRLRLRSAACAARFTARQGRRTADGTTSVRLRIDSRTALSAVSLRLPAALRLQGGAKQRRVGRLRVVVAGGRARSYALTLPAGKRSGVLSTAPGGPRVTFGPTGLRSTGLPADAGIVEVTANGVTGVAPGRTARLSARASGAAGPRTLTATLRAPRR
jgi:hypothetical protein